MVHTEKSPNYLSVNSVKFSRRFYSDTNTNLWVVPISFFIVSTRHPILSGAGICSSSLDPRLTRGSLLFRQYDTDSGGVKHPAEVRFVDLQMCQFGDLAFDLVYCLLTSSLRETRRDHLRGMITW